MGSTPARRCLVARGGYSRSHAPLAARPPLTVVPAAPEAPRQQPSSDVSSSDDNKHNHKDHHTGYLSTPAQWGQLRDGSGAATADEDDFHDARSVASSWSIQHQLSHFQPAAAYAGATNDYDANSGANAVTGHFSTPVLAAPHRTHSTTPPSSGSAAIVPSAAADAAHATTASQHVTGAEPPLLPRTLAAASPGLVSEHGGAAATPRRTVTPCASPVLVLGGPAPERPVWVPYPPVPNLDPATRWLPVPAVTGVAGYWAKIPELSAGSPMPIDVALGVNRLARSAHESIKGILLREDAAVLIVKARINLGLGMRMTHEERYPKDGSTHTTHMRRDVRPGRSVTRMYFTDRGQVTAEPAVVPGGEAGEVIRCRQWVRVASTGVITEQFFVGRKAPLPARS
eukprot:XP_001696298.1 predicted protein [Chlamydomonas reinhardtii]